MPDNDVDIGKTTEEITNGGKTSRNDDEEEEEEDEDIKRETKPFVNMAKKMSGQDREGLKQLCCFKPVRNDLKRCKRSLTSTERSERNRKRLVA